MNIAVVAPVLLVSSLLLCTSHCGNVTGPRKECMHREVSAHQYLFPGEMTVLQNIPEPCGKSGTIEVFFENKSTSYAVRINAGGPPNIAVYEKQATNSIMCLRTNTSDSRVNVTMYYCKPGFVYTPRSMCECPPANVNPNIGCSEIGNYSGVVVGYCASRASGKEPLLVARCAFASHTIQPIIPLEQNDITGEALFCQNFNRRGRLCSECTDGRALSVFSDTFDCIPCSRFKFRNLVLYLAIELIPTTVFVLIILLFHIGITTGPANGYIFFSQMITTPLEVLFLTFGWKLYAEGNVYLARSMPQWIINPYCIWNLTFFRIFHQDICLHPSLRVVHILALRLVLALYPLLLVMVTFMVIKLKARNIRVVTWLWRLVCFNCVRWRRVWQAKTSVINAFASCVLLSYTKVVQVSMLYLSPSDVNDDRGRTYGKVLSYDTSMPFHSKMHMPYMAVAIIMLLTLGALPPLILTFYQFRMLQNCLDRLRLRGVGMQCFVETFQGCYRDGTDGKTDCRFFAGLYFILRCTCIITMASCSSFPTCFTFMIVILALFLLLLAIVQPYRKRRYNIVDSAIIFLFIAITVLQMYIGDNLHQTLQISHYFLLYHFLLFLPLAYMVVYVVNWLYRQWKQRHNRRCETPAERQPDFYRESVLEERVPLRGESSPNRSSTRNQPSQTEVSVEELSDAEGINHDEIEGRRYGGERGREGPNGVMGRSFEAESGDDDEVREKGARPTKLGFRESGANDDNGRHFHEGDRPAHRELKPVMHYGTIQ